MLKFQISDSFNHLVKMIKIVYIILVIVSNMEDQWRIILQNFGLCHLSIAECREHSAVPSSTFIKLPFVLKTFVLSIFEWPLKTGFIRNYMTFRLL